MDAERIAQAEAHDQPELHQLWETVFGDTPEIVQAFFDRFPPEVSGWVLRRDGKLCSAAYVIPGNWLIGPGLFRPAGYVYAVATAPEERGRGYAGRLMRHLSEMAEERELLLYTRPAEASLFPWYAETMRAEHIGRTKEITISEDASAPAVAVRRISPEEYGALREQALCATTHILLSDSFLKLQEMYSDGYYASGDRICCCMRRENSLFIPEIIGHSAEHGPFVQGLLRSFGCKSAVLRVTDAVGSIPVTAYCGDALPEDTQWGLFLE